MGKQHFIICCSVWQEGIEWQAKEGVVVTVHIINNRMIQVIGANTSADITHESCQYLTDIIS